MTHKILIVEDDTPFGTMLQSWFSKNGFEAVLTSRMEQAKKEILEARFSLILADLRLPDGDGIMLLEWTGEQKKNIPVIVMTSYAEIQSAVSAMKLGAFDYIQKPVNPSALKQKIEQALRSEPVTVNTAEHKPGTVIGKSHVAGEMDKLIKMVAPTLMSVLIFGESGTGKEYAARRIHDLSKRREMPFIAVDCGSLSRELAPSELFGHLKGSFTSAVADKKGVFEQAAGGTVFLDEIGNLPYEVQIQLLRALQERKVRPVGSTKDIPVDVRIIAATNENLVQAIVRSGFREDLYHRLNEFSITVPPLRERKTDIGIFAMHFLTEANEELGKEVQSFSDETMQVLTDHYWSGNLRELRNVVRRSALFAQAGEITLADLPVLTSPLSKPAADHNFALRPENEREQIEAALEKTRGNKTLAAQLLKIDRKTLYNKMHQYDIKL
ncbi:MAG: sigma-54 dependent transcriptional regulator [Bacteroidales bacterium]|jgi:two-component system response regulator HydG|nr:sigma-54 dependent transcriptional regulator [Bacteroidales bacterium]